MQKLSIAQLVGDFESMCEFSVPLLTKLDTSTGLVLRVQVLTDTAPGCERSCLV